MRHTGQEYIAGVLAGNRRMVAKAITLVESSRAEDRLLAREVLAGLMPHTGGALRVGISGPPGAGKSTFIEVFGLYLIEQGLRVGVLAVDPSSRRSGGSILGDKTRMARLTGSRQAFIRPSPAGESLGGVARCTRESQLILEAAGYEIILIETVGVGQSETLVAGMVDLFVLMALPNAGDELQGMKRGIMELADLVLVNKSDGAFVDAAQRTAGGIESALRLLHGGSVGWDPEVMTISAAEGRGLAEVWSLFSRFREGMTASGALAYKRQEQARAWMWDLVRDGLTQRFMAHVQVKDILQGLELRVVAGEVTAVVAAELLLDRFTDGGGADGL
ncbi:methylmalonyl-CoA mutase metallochaperone MeaB [Magnetococcus marinus MC-1]|uniref:Methylmalonyl-CoA mutase metallochaperone MeaB n=1 Tax=Magnetococcus marinus (strain ATCC BAA-1437 / JCM 17883 / MC-1) TaxID=156889 RepID=A0L4M0_MAGMM|nr:methylmalonyl Co-A mutase-associated GTPase MeaB [Magnetococcus marinus]ABK42913.1 methylmalonyl-CoA mutase metallochaperone MeaB [Magnetococcus marinus MC-1]